MPNIIEIECPICHSNLWIDVNNKNIIQHEKTKKKNFKSFDELLLNEKEKKEKADEKFLIAKDLEKAKKKKAEDLFKKSIKEK